MWIGYHLFTETEVTFNLWNRKWGWLFKDAMLWSWLHHLDLFVYLKKDWRQKKKFTETRPLKDLWPFKDIMRWSRLYHLFVCKKKSLKYTYAMNVWKLKISLASSFLKSVNLQYNTLGRLDDGTNESSTKHLMFQV